MDSTKGESKLQAEGSRDSFLHQEGDRPLYMRKQSRANLAMVTGVSQKPDHRTSPQQWCRPRSGQEAESVSESQDLTQQWKQRPPDKHLGTKQGQGWSRYWSLQLEWGSVVTKSSPSYFSHTFSQYSEPRFHGCTLDRDIQIPIASAVMAMIGPNICSGHVQVTRSFWVKLSWND